MAVIVEHIKVVLQRYDYTNSTWANAAVLGDAGVISASVKKQCCPDGAFAIGGVYAAVLNLVCKVPGLTYFGMKQCRMKVSHQYGSNPFTDIGIFYVLDVQKHGEIFSVSAQDAVGWTDTSAMCANDSDDSYCAECGIGAFIKFDKDRTGEDYDLNGEMNRVITIANRFTKARTGVQNLLTWADYNVAANGWYYANQMVPDDQYDFTTNRYIYDPDHPTPVHSAFFPLYVPDGDYHKLSGSIRSDAPRDALRLLATIACGFIYAKPDGSLSLGQFGQPEYGMYNVVIDEETDTETVVDTEAQISTSDMELDTCEIADYDIQLKNTTLYFNNWYNCCLYVGDDAADYLHHAYIRYEVKDNPYLDGFYERWTLYPPSGTSYDSGQLLRGIWNHLSKYGYKHRIHETDKLQTGYVIRPFRCTVHKAEDYNLGQRVWFPDTQQESIITSIQWTFRGGWKLACGGEDGRTMADALLASKADKAIKMIRNDLDALRANNGLR